MNLFFTKKFFFYSYSNGIFVRFNNNKYLFPFYVLLKLSGLTFRKIISVISNFRNFSYLAYGLEKSEFLDYL